MNQDKTVRAEEAQKLLVTLQAKGNRPPLFMMAPLGYNPLSYRSLSRYLGLEQPFYTLQPLPAEHLHLHPKITVEEIASEYLREIRGVQPEGPYQLGGWSSGGLMAFEVAQQLRRKGESVHVIALLDAWAPGSRQAVSEIDDAALLVEIVKLAIADKGGSIDLSVEKMQGMSMQEQLNYAISRIREIAPASYHLNPEWLELQLQNIHLHQRAGRKYRPFSYDGRMVLFRAAKTLPEDARTIAKEGIDPVTLHYYGWNSLSTREVEVEIIPGYHFNIVLEPEVGTLAQRMQSYLLSPQSVGYKMQSSKTVIA
jgi:thioesterase domain-containing protein